MYIDKHITTINEKRPELERERGRINGCVRKEEMVGKNDVIIIPEIQK